MSRWVILQTMTSLNFKAGLAAAFFSLALSAASQPSDRAPESRDEVITRSELVVDLDKVFSQWEDQSSNYVTKGELSELRALVLQLREEMDGLGVRESNLESTVDGLEQRTRNTGRPGF